MINASIIGATGYAGAELVRILSVHPNINLKNLASVSYAGQEFTDIYAGLEKFTDIKCSAEDIRSVSESSDVVFLSMPHGIAAKMVERDLLDKTKIIDLGADFRLKDYAVYEKWYETVHASKELLAEAVYGLTEINRDRIKDARLIANPGCYTTCSILALYPLLKEKAINPSGIVIDAKSGVSGAGRGLALSSHYNECNESVKAYKVASHRHTPEIEAQLGEAAGEKINLVFTPHLIPMSRGILSTMYAKPEPGVTYDRIKEIYEDYYKDEYFIRQMKPGIFPETRWVRGANFCDIGFTVDERTNTLIIVSALDNLVKGAAGQAVQNMNLMFGLPENAGLKQAPVFI